MSDRGDELARRTAELKAESRDLVVTSKGLTESLVKTLKTTAQAAAQQGKRQSVPSVPDTGGDFPAGTGCEQASAPAASGAARGPGVSGSDLNEDVSVTWLGPGTGILDEDEAVALAVLLEDLAAGQGPDPLSGRALQVAALLRRVATRRRRGASPRWGGPAFRREAGDIRDGTADHRDDQAAQRDRCADERDDQAKERDRQADFGDERAAAGEQRLDDLLWAADQRDDAAAARPPASVDDGRQWQLDQDIAEEERDSHKNDREAFREVLVGLRAVRLAARRDRYAAGQDRGVSRRDRDDAQADRLAAFHDRQAARADRDQSVIESEEEHLPGDQPC